MKKNKLTFEELMEKLDEREKQAKVVTISSFLNILDDEETFVLYENGFISTGKYNGAIIVRLQDGYRVFYYLKEKVYMKNKKGEGQIVYPNCINTLATMEATPAHMKILEEFEQKLEAKKEELEKRNEKYKKIRQDHRIKHLFNHN